MHTGWGTAMHIEHYYRIATRTSVSPPASYWPFIRISANPSTNQVPDIVEYFRRFIDLHFEVLR
jgi:hypothetical protein